ncbi:beta-galactosidase [Paenibacillus donghaensis]|uniref:Glycoside hydrolase n=1 Tax=Paenibacillus donghaensis TaxID=414771 RepID=A0A2Z2KYV9_9BACL|nr:beta-galactosidase [Paenibacillus donghaensis]ASA25878.1 glycoside hydrolase [Paenibacillus donghaensis]
MSRRRMILFHDVSFPGFQPIEESADVLAAASLSRFPEAVNAAQLAEALDAGEPGGVFINLHAPYFPKAAWPSIMAYLRRGGGLLSIGGAPFKYPVRQESGTWRIEPEQTAYHRQLHIHEALRVDGRRVQTLTALEDIPLLQGQERLLQVTDTWNLVPHVTKSSDLPEQMGSSGPMDTRIYPLLKGISAAGREVSAPVVLWEHYGGPFAGGRWIFVGQPLGEEFWNNGGWPVLSGWAAFAAKGVTELWLKPNYACYEQGERPVLSLQTQRLSRSLPGDKSACWSLSLTLRKEGETADCFSQECQAQVGREMNILRIPVTAELHPGLYRLACTAVDEDGEQRVLRQGFWSHDATLLSQGTPITAGRDYFLKDGQPFPVVGMTYMTSDVARKFLFLPNAAVWDRDMAQMKRAGINWIRTGIWTAYRNVMQVDGHASEEVMRAIDAFLLTAKRHGLQVTFTFFSFTPETWEGKNPYLDPRSVEAQKRFIRSIVSRHCHTTHVDWDLINEPSLFDPPRIFSDGPSTAQDLYEQQAFAAWLEVRHGSIAVLQERWNMTPLELPDFAAALPPEQQEINFSVQDVHQGKRGTRWLDYCLFSMEMHNRWAAELSGTIKELCPGHLVTVGQDEALGAQRPSPFFYEQAVDYTTVHTWWLNDNLLWSGLFAKTASKPNLIQETGIMYVETPDGRAKRSEEELRAMLERKYAYAFASGGAGAVQWIWNTNYYMDNANESQIGALRADGTEKPEADVSYDFGRFIAESGHLFAGRKLEDIAVIFPYSNDFSNRKLAYEATTRLTRVLSYQLHLPLRAVSEYGLEVLKAQPPKLIILPSAHNLDDQAMETLFSLVEQTGTVLLVTGSLGINAYWQPSSRLDVLLGKRGQHNVRREERLNFGGRSYVVSYGQRRIAELIKEVPIPEIPGDATAQPVQGDSIIEAAVGKGRLIWCPLPLELNEHDEPIAELYRYAAAAAGVETELEWVAGADLPGVYGRKLSFAEGAVYIFVSEYAWDADIEVRDTATGQHYSFQLEQERSVLFAVDQEGQLLSVYRPEEVAVSLI